MPLRAGGPSVEPESEFVQVLLQVVGLDGALVGAQQPPLEQRSHPVDARQRNMSWQPGTLHVERFARVVGTGGVRI
jgi:hypothetical protein